MSRHSHLLLSLLFCFLLAISVLTPQTSSQSTLRSVSLNGTGASVDVPNNSTLNITGPITLEAWIKVNAIDGSYHDIVSRMDRNDSSSGGGYSLTVTDQGKLRLDLFQAHNSWTSVIGTTAMSAGAWHHVAGVFDGSQMRVYVDGVLDGSFNTTTGQASGTGLLRIGKAGHAALSPPLYLPAYAFAGLIDEVRVSAAALYSSNFTPGLGPGSNVRGLWKFDGQTANDFSGNGNHGALQNGATYSTDVPYVTNNPPAVSLTHPLNNTSIAAGSNIVMDATASDSDGSVTKVDFYQGTTLLGTDTTAPYTFVWTNVAAGNYSLTAKATDSASATTTSSAIAVTVVAAGGYHSVSLNGTGASVDVPSSSTLNITGPITLEAWIKVNAIDGSYHDIVSRMDRNDSSSGGGYSLTVTDQGKLRLDLFQAHNSWTSVIGTTAMSAGAWHHVAGVFDGSQMRVYVDGVLDGSFNTTTGQASGTGLLRIGKAGHAALSPPLYLPAYAFAGLIDEVRVSAAALYSSNFTPGLGPGSNVRGLWKFDGQTANDFSGNGNHGALQNGATYSTNVPPTGGGSQRPVPVAGGPYNGQPGQAVQFSSSGSLDPDGTITAYYWNFGDGTSANTANPSHTYATPGPYTATLTVTDNSGLLASATATVTIGNGVNARLDPLNKTGGGGENPLSRNFNWSLPLVSLPGRAGMDLGLTLSYNSLVWTRSGSYISFDDDRGFPGPGFRLGFPVIQSLYYNTEVGKYAYLLIGPDGSRTELRQVGSSALYEAADSSHLLLDSSTMTLRTTDGTQLKYSPYGAEFQCTEIKDRNGNYITVSYTTAGRINTVTDTLNRVITFNYDTNGWLTSITQVWNQNSTPLTHYWARFEYSNTTIDTNFPGLTIYGPADNTTIKTLSKVTLADDSHFDFAYTSWGQVWKVTGFAADNSVLNYRTYDLPQTGALAHDDCPRFLVRKDWARYWNGDTDGTTATNEEVATATFIVPVSDSWTMPDNTQQSGVRTQVTSADGTLNKIYYIGSAGASSGWRRGLPALVETHSGGTWRRKVMTTWTQDNTSVAYPLNPRVLETNIYDPEGNRARTQITYQQFPLPNNLSCHLPRDLYEYAGDASTILRSTRTSYNMSDPYKDRRILGLLSAKELYEGNVNTTGTLKSKVEFFYDNENGSNSIQGTDEPVQHDNAAYSSSFVSGRANLSSVKRHNVENEQSTTSRTKYNTAGAVVSSKDALDHEVTISYADSFSDNNNSRNTLAYPTTVTDPDGYSSTSKYHFDFGAMTRQQTPLPNVTTNTPGPEQSFTFDAIGRLQQVTNLVNNAYTRFEYPTSQIRVDTYTTIQEGLGEAHSFKITDGMGRVVATAKDHPWSTGGFSGQKLIYDVMGRLIKTSNPTETSASGHPSQWNTAGDDASAGWLYTEQTYDWKGRPLVTMNQDGTTSTASYSGCGCAGGEIVTLTDEGTIDGGVAKRRQQKLYTDVLGRIVKTELLNWAGGTIYSATTKTYNVRDQVEVIKQYAGPENPGNPFQETTYTYDGFGRLRTKHLPQESAGTETIWTYNADDTVNTITDARGAVSTFGYVGTNRGLVKTLTHTLSGKPTINKTFNYDSVGNRVSMADESGTATYGYNQSSQLTSESKTLGGTAYTLSYEYNLAGKLKKMTYPGNVSINYGYDKAGRLTAVTGSDTLIQGITQYASAFAYRASGARKTMTDGANRTTTLTHDARLRPATFQISGGVVNQSYEYYNDGRMRFVQNQSDNNFDRFYSYDHADRLTSATTGGAARGDLGAIPYYEQISYNAWGDTTSRMTETWSTDEFADGGTYTNGRRDGWQYEADGQIKTIDTRTYSYDAAGSRVLMTGQIWSGSNYFPISTASAYDGDGTKVEEVSTWPTTFTTRYLRSTVLHGEIVQEINSAGQTIRYVYLPDGTRLSTLNGPAKWKHETPGGTGLYETFQSGFVNRVEFDPYRANVGLTVPPPPDTNGGDGDIGLNHNGGLADSRFSNMANPAAGCFSVGGVDLPCTWSSFDVFEFFVWGPARQPAVSVPTDIAVWVPPKRVVPINIPNPFDTYLDTPVDRVDVTYSAGFWRAAPAPFLNISAAQVGTTQNTLPYVDRTVLTDCIRPQFGVELRDFHESHAGVNGSFKGYGPDTGYTGTNPSGPFEYANSNPGSDAEFEVINEVRAYSGNQLGGFANKYSGGKIPKGWVYGYTGPTPSGYSSYRNFTAKDLKDPMRIIITQVHELGNSLRDITTAANNDKKFVTNPGEAPDADAGAKLEKCVREHKGFSY